MDKITIHNKRKDYTAMLHTDKIVINDYNCDASVRIRKHDYALRAVWEIQRRHTAVFLMLSYNPMHVPMLYYNGDCTMCFNCEHIQVLLKSIKDKFGADHVSWLIGAEFGVDKNFTERPHYHPLFMLDECVDPNDFTEFVRTVWTGKKYGRKNQSWRFGNLGFVFPSPKDCKLGAHIARNNNACATYAAKYAVKQVGFYNKPLINRVLLDGKKSFYKNSFPRVFTSHHFGANMEQDVSFNLLDGTVNNPVTNKPTNIPIYNRERVMVKRWFNGDFRPVMCVSNYCKITRNDEHLNGVIKSLSLDANGMPKLRRNYERSYTVDAILLRCRQLPYWVNKYALKFASVMSANIGLANRVAIYHYVYKGLPLSILYNVVKRLGFDYDSLYNYNTYIAVYKYCKLFRNLSLDKMHRVSDINVDRWGVLWTPLPLSVASSSEFDEVVMLEDKFTSMLDESAFELDIKRAIVDKQCDTLLKFIKPEEFEQ